MSHEACGGLFVSAAPVGEGFVTVMQSATRPPELVVIGEDGSETTIVETSHAGTELIRSSIGSRRVADVDRARRSGDQRDPHAAGRRTAVPADPRGSRRSGLGVSGPLARRVRCADGVTRLRGPDVEPPGLVGEGTGVRRARRGRHGRSRRAGPARRDRPRGVARCGRPRADRRDRRQLRRLHVGMAAVHRPTVPRGGRDLARHRLVLRAVRQQPRIVGLRLPRRRSGSHDRTTTATGAPCSSPTGTARRRCSRPGANDRATPIGQAVEFHRALREHDVPSDVVRYPLEGHGVRDMPAAIDLVTRSLSWFERFMPPDPAAR